MFEEIWNTTMTKRQPTVSLINLKKKKKARNCSFRLTKRKGTLIFSPKLLYPPSLTYFKKCNLYINQSFHFNRCTAQTQYVYATFAKTAWPTGECKKTYVEYFFKTFSSLEKKKRRDTPKLIFPIWFQSFSSWVNYMYLYWQGKV